MNLEEQLEQERTGLPRLLAAVEAVLKLHRKAPLYGHEDECANPDERHREDRHFEIDGEYVCEALIEDWTCAECYEIQDIASLAEPISWPCDTVRALTQALEGTTMTDLMDRVREKARDESTRRWGHRKPFDENPPNHGPMDWLDDGMAAGFVLGAMWQAGRTLTNAEWEQTREDVAREICHEDDSDPLGEDEYDDLDERFQRGYLKLADTAMRALGFKREWDD